MYLGLPHISDKLNSQHSLPLVQKIWGCIDSWTNRFLSLADRLQLIKSVLMGVHGYWTTHIFIPKSVIKKIQSVLANFSWGGSSNNSAHQNISGMVVVNQYQDWD